MKKNLFTISLCLIFSLLLLTGCGKTEQSVLGSWNLISSYGDTKDSPKSTYDFNDNGEVIINGEKGTYTSSPDNSSLTIEINGEMRDLQFFVQKETLFVNYKTGDKVTGTSIFVDADTKVENKQYASKDVIEHLANNLYNLEYKLYTKNLEIFSEDRLVDEFVLRNAYLFKDQLISEENATTMFDFTKNLVSTIKDANGSLKVKKVIIDNEEDLGENKVKVNYTIEAELKNPNKEKKSFKNSIILTKLGDKDFKINKIESLNLQ